MYKNGMNSSCMIFQSSCIKGFINLVQFIAGLDTMGGHEVLHSRLVFLKNEEDRSKLDSSIQTAHLTHLTLTKK